MVLCQPTPRGNEENTGTFVYVFYFEVRKQTDKPYPPSYFQLLLQLVYRGSDVFAIAALALRIGILSPPLLGLRSSRQQHQGKTQHGTFSLKKSARTRQPSLEDLHMHNATANTHTEKFLLEFQPKAGKAQTDF